MTGSSAWDIRPATVADVPRLKELGVLGWESTYTEIVRPENRARYLAGAFWSPDTLTRVVTDPACLALAAASPATVLGFLTVEPVEPRIVELTRFYVDPTLRRAGIGSALYAAALEWARDRSARTMLVNVFAENRIGCAFYERAGFRLTCRCPTTVGDQDVADAWYELELD
jgi:GNAT superfamily N-acetyltransferase